MSNDVKKTVMIVDDETNICELIRLYVEKEGFKAVQVNDGDVAIEMFRLIQPDIVILEAPETFNFLPNFS